MIIEWINYWKINKWLLIRSTKVEMSHEPAFTLSFRKFVTRWRNFKQHVHSWFVKYGTEQVSLKVDRTRWTSLLSIWVTSYVLIAWLECLTYLCDLTSLPQILRQLIQVQDYEISPKYPSHKFFLFFIYIKEHVEYTRIPSISSLNSSDSENSSNTLNSRNTLNSLNPSNFLITLSKISTIAYIPFPRNKKKIVLMVCISMLIA